MDKENIQDAGKLKEYLMQDLALAKLRLAESRRNQNRLLYLVILLLSLFLVCVAGFAGTVWLVSREHTRQIEAICRAGYEVSSTTEQEKEHVYQEGVSGGAILNNHSSINDSKMEAKR